MASRRKEHQEEVKLRVFQIISANPQMTSRELAQKVGISNGSAFYLLTALIDKGYFKLESLKKNSRKRRYAYLLTPKGIREKSLIANKFLVRKKQEYQDLKKEIESLEKSVGKVTSIK